jgi:hypothetical protein
MAATEVEELPQKTIPLLFVLGSQHIQEKAIMAKGQVAEVEPPPSVFQYVCKLGERATSDVIVRLRTVHGRDDWFYSHSEVLCAKSKYFATRLSDDWPTYNLLDSRNCVDVVCIESDIDHHVNLLRMLYSNLEEPVGEMWHSVKNALGMLKVATKLGCDAIASKCARYLEAVPWEENEEEEILKALPGRDFAFGFFVKLNFILVTSHGLSSGDTLTHMQQKVYLKVSHRNTRNTRKLWGGFNLRH